MTTIKAIIRNGRIETNEPLNLPEATHLLIPVPSGSGDEEEGWDNSPEGIAAWLKCYDTLKPLIFTAEERTAWEAERQARKAWDKAHFDTVTEKLKKVWE